MVAASKPIAASVRRRSSDRSLAVRQIRVRMPIDATGTSGVSRAQALAISSALAAAFALSSRGVTLLVWHSYV